MKNFEACFVAWIVNNPLKIIALCILLILVPSTGFPKLYFDTSYRVFFGKDNPQLAEFEAIEELTDAAWQVPHSRRVDSITNFQYTYAKQDDLIVQDMAKNVSTYTQEQLLSVRKAVLAEPALLNRLISQSGHVTAVNITVSMSENELGTAIPAIVKDVRRIAKELEQQYPNLKTYLSGVVLMNNSFPESAIKDCTYLVPISFVLMMGLISILVGGIAGTFATMIIIFASTLRPWVRLVTSVYRSPA